jgi:type III secretion protein J
MRAQLNLSILLLAGCSTQIQHGLDEREANEIMAELVSRGFVTTKIIEKGKKPTFAIEVDDAHAVDAMRVLTDLKLPRPQRLKTQALASSPSLIDTPTAERLRQLEAEEGDIEESLESMAGVTSAAVELVVSAPARPGQAAIPSKASVLLRIAPEAIERLQMQRAELRALVAGAVDGLAADDVVLVLDPVPPFNPRPVTVERPALRPMVIVLGFCLTLAAMLVVFLAWRLRAANRRERAPSNDAVSAPKRPVISPAIQRKAA